MSELKFFLSRCDHFSTDILQLIYQSINLLSSLKLKKPLASIVILIDLITVIIIKLYYHITHSFCF